MSIKYCLPVIKSTKSDVLKDIHINRNEYDYFEVWLDYVKDLEEKFIENLQKLLKDRLILLFRRKRGEKTLMKLAQKLNVISLLKGKSSFIDLDIFSQGAELNFIKNNKFKVKTIISYHNYELTPESKELKEIIMTIIKYEPEIIKIATKCNNQKDALRLLKVLLRLKEAKKRCIILGIGEAGRVTRIFGTLWGNEMIFAPKTVKEKSAPGQLTKNQLEIIFKELEN